MLVSIVLPVHNEESTLLVLFLRLRNALKELYEWDFEIIFVDDGSTDSSLSVLQELKKNNKDVKIIEFSRNFGHQAAITAGINHANGDIIITMDSDLQDPPELIKEMLQAWKNGCAVVHATRSIRKGETWFKKSSAAVYYRFMSWIGVNLLKDTGDFRLITREVAEALKQMPEKRQFIRGMIPWLGFKQGQVYYDRDPRYSGKSNYSLQKMLRLAGDGAFSFSTCLPKIPFIFALINAMMQQWNSAMILVSLGIISEYALRIYDEVRGRPLYILQNNENQQQAQIRDYSLINKLSIVQKKLEL